MTDWVLPYKPSEVQLRAHALQVDELLAGGAAGGGKSALLLGYAITHCLAVPGAKVGLFRRSLPELEAELEPRLLEWVPDTVARYNSQKHVMTFHANGSQLRLGYLEAAKDIYRYQGVQFSCLLFDELTQFDWDSYTYLKSRLRVSGRTLEAMNELGITPRVISTTNPGGKSHHQVKEYFVDVAPPNEVYTDPETGLTRAYVPFRFTDNAHIDTEEYGKQLAGLPEHMRRALMDGDWGVLEGTRFPQFRERIHVIKPEEFPIPVVGTVRVVGVDYGINDPMAAVWMAKVGDTIVVYRDHVESGLASSQQAQRVKELEDEEERVHSEVTVALDPNGWARNPAFGGVKLGPGSDEAPLGSIAHYFRQALGDRVVKGWNPRVQGWAIFDELFIERDTGVLDENGEPVKLPRILIYDTCRDLIKGLQAAPRSKRDPQDIDTNWKDDHVCFVGETPVETEHGPRRIDSVVVGDRVWTRGGLRTVVDARCTARDAVVGEVVLSNGERIVGTGNHPVFLEDGTKVTLDALRYADKLVSWETVNKSLRSPSSTTGASTHGHPSRPTGLIGSTTGSAGAESVFTVPSTGTTTGPSRTASTSTTPTMTRSTTTRLTSWLSRRTNTSPTTPTSTGETSSTGLTASSTWTTSGTSRKRGTPPKPGTSGTSSTASGSSATSLPNSSRATSAAKSSRPAAWGVTGFAPVLAGLRGAGMRASTMWTGRARSAVAPTGRTSTQKTGPAPVYVVGAFNPLPRRADVYNLTVDEHHEYFVHGVLVSNCDAARYAVAEILGRQYASPPSGHERLALEGARSTVTGDLGTRGF